MKNKIYLTLIFLVIGFVLYCSRQIFFFQHEPKYFEDWYYHSQWNIPASTRGMSDGPLYMFVGDRLVAGENPFNINFEIPPLGKNLYGLSSKLLNNPYWLSVVMYLLSVFFFWKLISALGMRQPLLATLLFVTTPFVSLQIKETMLDLPLMFFYLIHFLLFVKFLNNKKLLTMLFSGLFLGLATATKPGVYTPLVAILGMIMIYLSQRRLKECFLYPVSIFAGYVLGFFPSYFIRHPNPIPWLRLHERSIRFYLEPQNTADYLAQWKTIFGHLFESGWWNIGIDKFGDWTLVLPLGVIALAVVLIAFKKKHHPGLTYLGGVALVFLLINTVIHFWPRYLMPIVPIFVIFIAQLLRNRKWLMLIIIALNMISTYNVFTLNKVGGHAEAFSRFYTTRANHELYRTINKDQRKGMDEEYFVENVEKFFDSIHARDIKSEIIDITEDSDRTKIKFRFTYTTKYGNLVNEPTVDYLKEHNEWKSVWNWSHLWPGYTPESQISIVEDRIAFSQLIDTYKNVVAVRAKGYELYKITRVMFNWGKDLDDMAKATGKESMEIDRRIKTVVPDHKYRFIDYVNPNLTPEEFEKAKSIPGVKLLESDYVSILDKKSKEDVLRKIKDARTKWPELFYVRAKAKMVDAENNEVEINFGGVDKLDTVLLIDKQGMLTKRLP